MAKYKYHTEYEINASPRMLFNYLSTASGLQDWLAEKVNILPDKKLDIYWEGESHKATITAKRTNNHIRFEFEKGKDEEQAQYLDFRLEYSDMTQTSFLKIIDFSDMDDEDDLEEMWDQLIGHLKEVTGG